LSCLSLKQICNLENAGLLSSLPDLAGDDLILCQITTQSRRDTYSVPLASGDFDSGRLNVDSFVRANRLFTIDHSVIVLTAAKIKGSKLDEVRAQIRQLFN
jgi:mRNA interferase MazF